MSMFELQLGLVVATLSTACANTKQEHRALDEQRARFEADAGIRRLSCQRYGSPVFKLLDDCSGILSKEPVRYTCIIDRGCQWETTR